MIFEQKNKLELSKEKMFIKISTLYREDFPNNAHHLSILESVFFFQNQGFQNGDGLTFIVNRVLRMQT